MHDGVHALQRRIDRRAVAKVALDEFCLDTRQILAAAHAFVVEHDERADARLIESRDEVGADKAASPGDQDRHRAGAFNREPWPRPAGAAAWRTSGRAWTA